VSMLQLGNQLLGAAGGNVPASLSSTESFLGLPLSFSLNPKSVSMTKSNKTESDVGVITSTFNDAIKATSNVRLKLGEAYLTGAGFTSMAIDTLLEWATPIQISAADALAMGAASAALNLVKSGVSNAASGAVTAGMNTLKNGLGGSGSTSLPSPSYTHEVNPLKAGLDAVLSMPVYYRLPILRFMWGFGAPLNNTTVNLESVTIDYQRFDFSGTPVWAKVGLTLVEYSSPWGPTNPTSGGVAGRTKHVLSQGENVMQIAQRAYGSPNAWRRVAEANGVDDPLRLKPGRTLMLPPADAAPEVTK
jgi:hypothetical protein